jgi:hypothetical protein
MDVPCIELGDDRRSLLMLSGSTPPIIWKMSAAVVDEVIEKLCFFRGDMLPEIPATWPGRQTITAQRDPAFTIEIEPLNGDPLCHIKHPHFGWLHFIFSKSEARKFGEALIARADAKPPALAAREKGKSDDGDWNGENVEFGTWLRLHRA